MRLTQFLLLEAREDYIAQHMGPKLIAAYQKDNGRKPPNLEDPLQLVKYLAQAGPEFVQWIARQYVGGLIKYEDLPQVKNDLIQFKQLVKANKTQNKDINNYPTIAALRQDIRDKSTAGEEYSGKYEKLYQGINEAVQKGLGKWLYNKQTDPVKIYIPTSEAGSVCIRKAYPDISWCTTYEDDNMDEIKRKVGEQVAEKIWNEERRSFRGNEEDAWDSLLYRVADEIEEGQYDDLIAEQKENMHDYYLKEYGGEFYVILTPTGPYQFHFESNQFKDQNDEDVDFNQLVGKYPTIKNILAPIINKIGHPHFLPAEDIESIKKAVMASYENMPLVKFEQLSREDWANVILQKLGKLDSYSDPKEIQEILSKANSAMRYKGSMGYLDRGAIFEKIVQAKPNQIKASHIPYDVLQSIDPEIGQKYIKMYVPPQQPFQSNHSGRKGSEINTTFRY